MSEESDRVWERMSGELRNRVRKVCATLPGTECSDPCGGGHDAWQVGGKMFACIGAVTAGVAVKTRDIETAQMLIDTGIASKAPYFHRSWVQLPEDCAVDKLRHRLIISYDLIRASLTKKLRSALPPREGIA